MSSTFFAQRFRDLWTLEPEDARKPGDLLLLVGMGFLIGLISGGVISVFRITTGMAYGAILRWVSLHEASWLSMAGWLCVALAASLIVCFLTRRPPVRFGGSPWIRKALSSGQPGSWHEILLPKFMGSWLVMSCGVSVGSEGPCIEMGAATALGLKRYDPKEKIERRFFILGGCASGLAAAFSAPFAGVCYVYEIMREKMSGLLLMFMLAGGFGVYVSATLLFGLDVLMPLGDTLAPGLLQLWLLLPLGIFAGLAGAAYNYMLRLSIEGYARQRLVPQELRPIIVFLAAGLMVIFFPALSGEGLNIFHSMEAGEVLTGFLCFFVLAKIVFTAFCYGSGIPAGLMVPVLCVGGVMGAIFFQLTLSLGLISEEYLASFMAMGMVGSFSASERAPITGLVLVLQMTGAYALALPMLLVAATAAFTGRLCRVKSI